MNQNDAFMFGPIIQNAYRCNRLARAAKNHWYSGTDLSEECCNETCNTEEIREIPGGKPPGYNVITG